MTRSMKIFMWLTAILFIPTLVLAATIHGSIYNSQLTLEKDVLVQVDSVPEQKFLAKSGEYQFQLPTGKYTLTATKNELSTSEQIQVGSSGDYILDLFLLPGLGEEEDLWNEIPEEELIINPLEEKNNTGIYFLIGGVLIAIGIGLWLFSRSKKQNSKPSSETTLASPPQLTPEEHQQALAAEPGYVEEAVEIIKKHGGRIYQKELRKEMLHLSEAKVSLILTELEHKGRIEKIKKGRGNAIILKS